MIYCIVSKLCAAYRPKSFQNDFTENIYWLSKEYFEMKNCDICITILSDFRSLATRASFPLGSIFV